jgi:hypothetical protein
LSVTVGKSLTEADRILTRLVRFAVPGAEHGVAPDMSITR